MNSNSGKELQKQVVAQTKVSKKDIVHWIGLHRGF